MNNQFITHRDDLLARINTNSPNDTILSTPSFRHSRVGPADLWEMKRQFQIEFLIAAGLKPFHDLLDFGCGTLRGGIPLVEYLNDEKYTGIDVRQDVLEEGIKELSDHGLDHKKPRLECHSQFAELDLRQKFNIVWAFSVLIHLENHILHNVLGFISRHLHTGGTFFANVNISSQTEGSWQGFPIVYRTFDFYKQIFQENGLFVSDLGSLQEFGHYHPRLSKEVQDSQRMLCGVKYR